MPELKFKAWEPPKQKRKAAGLPAAQPTHQCLSLAQDPPAQGSRGPQNGIEPGSSGQVQKYHSDVFPAIDTFDIDVALSIFNDDMYVESDTIRQDHGPIDLTGPSQASPSITQFHLPYYSTNDKVDNPPMESEDGDHNVDSGNRTQFTETSILSLKHTDEELACTEDYTAIADSSIDSPLVPSTYDPSPPFGNGAVIDTLLKGPLRDRSDNASQSPSEHVSKKAVNGDLQPETRSCRRSLTCNGSETSISSPSCAEHDPANISGPSIRADSPTAAPIAYSSSRDSAPGRLAESSTKLTVEVSAKQGPFRTSRLRHLSRPGRANSDEEAA
ncbi:hypothetical protein F5B19DRAFT_236704 [Rostrohypoxylon terebratum]|nr:hypothetical protein F5B19DRAFT_236704 [Rostrohypoxylon terebratum]